MRSGDSKIHTPATAVLVAGLATCAPLCRRHEDLALLAFFNEVPVPPDAVREALADVYFPQHAEAREQENMHLQRIPVEHRGEHGPEYDWAEAVAASDMEEYEAAVRQMRDNLRGRRDLAAASQDELDGRVRGVLIWLNMPALPVHDSEFMGDLRAAMAFCGPPVNSRAAWLLAAVCHSQQLAKRSETCARERRENLMAVTGEELGVLREQVRESLSSFNVATDRVTGPVPATHRAPVPLEEVFYVSTHRRGSLVGCLSCRTRPASRPGRVGHHAHRHPRG
ncbi:MULTISPECIES: hypothetical protein [Streptomyces]|uniref:Uncharacterized protein n=1 Tax=Streptomyces eurythermus TaxID=42237 RepID=A0ABW6Z8X8_9ACTN|nr:MULTISPECIES: hypothetical protein [Streptomyces]QIS68612.1 hypothetical protein HB370_00520 [Streptomyces sp. DSM 40868]